MRVITSGISANDEVIVDGLQMASIPGAHVKTMEAPPAATATPAESGTSAGSGS